MKFSANCIMECVTGKSTNQSFFSESETITGLNDKIIILISKNFYLPGIGRIRALFFIYFGLRVLVGG